MAMVLVLSVLSLMLLLIWKTYLNRRKYKTPPLAEGALPIIGHTALTFVDDKKLYKTLIDDTLGASIKKGHEIVTIRVGSMNVYVALNPEDSYEVANSCTQKDFLYKFFKPLCGDDGLITAGEQVWKRHRKLLNPTFNQGVLDTYIAEFNVQSRQLVACLTQEVGRGCFDQLPYLRHMALNLVCKTIMGVDVKEKEVIAKAGEAFEVFTKCLVERIKKFWYYNDFIFNLSNTKRKHFAAAKIFLELTHEVLRKKKANLIAREGKAIEFNEPSSCRYKSFLDLLLELSEKDSLTESEIIEEVNTFIAAAFDTTYHTVGNTLLTLGSYPEIQRKVFEELQEVFQGSDRDINRQDISKMKYLEAAIKETMRLYPTVITLGRSLDKEIHLKNYILPSGSSCYVSIYHVNRHSSWGPDADVFRPERWLDGSLPANVSKAFASFGLGRRGCIGTTYALMSMKTALAHVLRRYRVSGDVTKLVLRLDVVITPMSGHQIRIEPREEPNANNGKF